MSVLSKEFLDIQATIGCTFTLKWVLDMIHTVFDDIVDMLSNKKLRSIVRKLNRKVKLVFIMH